MYTLRRFSPHLYALALFGAFFWLYREPSDFLGVTVESFGISQMIGLYTLLFFLLSLTIIALRSKVSFFALLRFSIFPHFLLFSSYFLFLITDHPQTLMAIVVGIPLISWFWLENLYLFWQRTEVYQAYTLERLASYFYVILAFIFAYALSGAQTLIQLPFWLVSLIFVLIMGVLFFDLLQLHKFDPMESFVLSTMGVVLGTQLLFTLSVLPAHFILSSISIALFFYFWAGMCKLILARNTIIKNQITYVAISSIGFVAVFVSSLFVN